MRRTLFALGVLIGLSLPVGAIEPRASITGPTSALVGQAVLLDLAGSVSDPDYPLQVEVAGSGEFRPTLRLWYDEQHKPGLAVLTAPRPGAYTIVVVAIGKPDGAQAQVTRIAAWPLTVEPIDPAPKPPTPGPEPTPPAPTPITGKLWGVLILSDLPTPAEAALRTDPDVRKAFTDANATFRTYLESETEIQQTGWKLALANAGGAPCMLWIDESKRILRATIRPDEAQILADLKTLRGGR